MTTTINYESDTTIHNDLYWNSFISTEVSYESDTSIHNDLGKVSPIEPTCTLDEMLSYAVEYQEIWAQTDCWETLDDMLHDMVYGDSCELVPIS